MQIENLIFNLHDFNKLLRQNLSKLHLMHQYRKVESIKCLHVPDQFQL
jgi:hypothetical protein